MGSAMPPASSCIAMTSSPPSGRGRSPFLLRLGVRAGYQRFGGRVGWNCWSGLLRLALFGVALSEVGLNDLWIGQHALRLIFSYLAPVVHHQYTIGDTRDRAHDMFDDHHGDAGTVDLPDQSDGLGDFGWRQTSHDLVEQEQAGIVGQRTGQLQALAICGGELVAF